MVRLRVITHSTLWIAVWYIFFKCLLYFFYCLLALTDAQLREFKEAGEIVVDGFTLTAEDIHVCVH